MNEGSGRCQVFFVSVRGHQYRNRRVCVGFRKSGPERQGAVSGDDIRFCGEAWVSITRCALWSRRPLSTHMVID